MTRTRPKALSKQKKDLLVQMERLIGNSCFNGNIQNYYMWEWEDEGRWFRYPLTFIDKHGQKDKQYYPNPKMASDKLRTGYYAFGANQLHIVDGLIDVLNFLEENYGLLIDDEQIDASYHPIGAFNLLCAIFGAEPSRANLGCWMKNFTLEKSTTILDVLDTLKVREKRIIVMRYGLTDADENTLQDIANDLKLTRERIRQIQNDALRKLRHPTRIRKLEPLVSEFDFALIPQNESERIDFITDALDNILYGEKIPLDIVNSVTGEILVPANRKITKTLIRKIAENYQNIEIDPSPIRIKVMGIIDEYRK